MNLAIESYLVAASKAGKYMGIKGLILLNVPMHNIT